MRLRDSGTFLRTPFHVMSSDVSSSDESIGNAVRIARGEMSQTELANRMREYGHKWVQQTVVAVEKGNRSLRLAEAFDLVKILQLPNMFDLESNPVGRNAFRIYMTFVAAQDELLTAAQNYDALRVKYATAALDAARANSFIDYAPRVVGRTPEEMLAVLRKRGKIEDPHELPELIDELVKLYGPPEMFD